MKIQSCVTRAGLGWMAQLANLHMKCIQQRGKLAAKSNCVEWGMQKAESEDLSWKSVDLNVFFIE